jgi:uncharacterized membrane protein
MNAAEGNMARDEGSAGGAATPVPEKPRPARGRQMRRHFLTGLLVLLPAYVSIFVLWRIFSALDRLLGQWVVVLTGHKIPGVGFVALLLIILGIGAVAGNIIGKRMIRVGEGVVGHVPVVRWIYATTKQLFATLLEEKSTSFRKVVLVEFPRRGIYSLGFVTAEAVANVDEAVGTRTVAVFVPTTPNPTSGFFLFVPEDDVIPLGISVREGLGYVISAGTLAQDKVGADE